ncbi:porphobilinogen synthase [Membranihabitans maritimus]|uniref:porphobilinogen synthase n=1 Tax=Membranihabitans maritimus TaxID=2904244 RepID=UPI002104D801|nr:porphobilinogen synthase [Membranihabitans maritimus]
MLRRPRRNRASKVLRSMVRENFVTTDDLIYPMFVMDGENKKEEIKSLPGNFRFSQDRIIEEIGECIDLGLKSFMIFPAVEESLKDSHASYSYSPENFYLQIASELKSVFPSICLISDVAMDPYSSDGHDGIVEDGKILNDESLEILGKMSLAQAEAGFDLIGPSDMMDGRVQYIREILDRNGYTTTGIMSYTAKYASAFYGPFRDALNSAPKFGDKKSYQMDPSNQRDAMIEADLDTMEGADFLMVKPAVHYLDIIHLLKSNYPLPIAGYHVSGECAMLMAAIEKGYIDGEKAIPETLLSLKRAGCDVIITYLAKGYAKSLNH